MLNNYAQCKVYYQPHPYPHPQDTIHMCLQFMEPSTNQTYMHICKSIDYPPTYLASTDTYYMYRIYLNRSPGVYFL